MYTMYQLLFPLHSSSFVTLYVPVSYLQVRSPGVSRSVIRVNTPVILGTVPRRVVPRVLTSSPVSEHVFNIT